MVSIKKEINILVPMILFGAFYSHVICKVEDINVQAPTDITVIEAAATGTIVGMFTIHAIHGPVTVYTTDNLRGTIVGTNLVQYSTRDNITDTEYELILKKYLDREQESEVTLHFSVVDNMMQKVDFQMILHILDINDNPPQFEMSHYSFDVPRNAPLGTTIGQVRAVDADIDLNGRISFTIQGSAEVIRIFRIDPFGSLTLVEHPEPGDLELNFTVRASDQGIPAKSSDVKVTVTM